MIPKIIHFFWTGSEMPEWAHINIAQFEKLNPGYKIMLHGEEVISDKYLELAEKIKSRDGEFLGNSSVPANLSDLGRYSALEKYGGWYFDVDIYPLRPIEEIERAYCLDGTRLFMSKQLSSKKPRINGRYYDSYLAAAVLGIGTCKKAKKIIQQLSEIVLNTTCEEYAAYGPYACTELAYDYPHLCEVAEPEWFFGIGPQVAAKIYTRVLSGDLTGARKYCTNGQLPYTLHLWAQGWADKIKTEPSKTKTVAFCGDNIRTYLKPKGFGNELRAGFKKAGYEIDEVKQLGEKHEIPDIVVTWNNRTATEKASIDYACKMGCKIAIMELGFINRSKHCQIDSLGFSHNASWKNLMTKNLTKKEKELLDEKIPEKKPVAKRKGYILVIGQVNGDTQLLDSEIRAMPQLQRLMARNVPKNKQVFFRPHPLDNSKPHPKHVQLPRLDLPAQARQEYEKNQQSFSLQEALDGAAFVVTINSTAIIEATIAGVPCMAFGPSLAIDAGAVKRCKIETLKDDLKSMADGWVPSQKCVNQFLYRMLDNQYHISELSNPDFVEDLIEVLK